MKQPEAVLRALRNLNGIATLGQLNHEVPKIEGCVWKTKTPFASIRRIVQLHKDIYKIRPGLYALKSERARLESEGVYEQGTQPKEPQAVNAFNHSYYQGLLLEIGNFKGLATYCPPQDKNKLFLSRPLGEVSSVGKIFEFSYDTVIARAKTIDVIWFNDRHFMASAFEVEHSTDIQNSLLKYADLQDFHTSFYIVGDAVRKKEFDHKLAYSSFRDLKSRVEFLDYDAVAQMHTRLSELHAIRQW